MDARELLETSHNALMAELAGIKNGDKEAHAVVGHWNVRDVLGNILASTRVLEELLQNYLLPSPESEMPMLQQLHLMSKEEFNDHHYKEYQYAPYSQVYSDYIVTYNHINQLLNSIPKKEWADSNIVPWADKKITIQDFVATSIHRNVMERVKQLKEFRKNIDEIKHTPSKPQTI